MYTTCRVGVLSSEISKHSKISPPPSLRSHLTSSPMGVLSGDYGSSIATASSVVLVWLHIIRFSFSKKAIKEQKFSFSFSWSTKMKKGLLKHSNHN